MEVFAKSLDCWVLVVVVGGLRGLVGLIVAVFDTLIDFVILTSHGFFINYTYTA